MYAEERQQALVERARLDGRISVAGAAAEFNVAMETIRRDLAALDEAGLLRRVHGGAVPTESLALVERDVATRQTSFVAEKDRIATAALAHVPTGAGSSLILDAGTTLSQFASRLTVGDDVTIVTNSVPVAGLVAARCSGPVHMVGGHVRGLTQATVGPEAVRMIERLRVDVAFLGTNGFTLEHGCSTPHPDEAAVKHAMVRAARRVVVLADSSKVGAELLRSFADAADVDVLITDSGVSMTDRARFSDSGIEVVIA